MESTKTDFDADREKFVKSNLNSKPKNFPVAYQTSSIFKFLAKIKIKIAATDDSPE